MRHLGKDVVESSPGAADGLVRTPSVMRSHWVRIQSIKQASIEHRVELGVVEVASKLRVLRHLEVSRETMKASNGNLAADAVRHPC